MHAPTSSEAAGVGEVGIQVIQVGQVAVIGLGCKQRQHFTEDIGLKAAHTQGIGSEVELTAMQEQGPLDVPAPGAVRRPQAQGAGLRRVLCRSEGCSAYLKQGQQAQKCETQHTAGASGSRA